MSADDVTLVVPAAGVGSRLGSVLPKLLVPVDGRPMLDYLVELYAPVVRRFVFVVRPGVEADVEARGRALGIQVACAVQATPTGMLDAILLSRDAVSVSVPDWVWITWCDQVAVLPETVSTLCNSCTDDSRTLMAFPTCRQPDPYIHFDRNDANEIIGLRQRREGDAMPAIGESDAGLFALARTAFFERLPAFALEAGVGSGTGERNFLPFIPWLSARHPGSIRTWPCRDAIETVGINSPDDLRRIETHFANRRRSTPAPPSDMPATS